MNKDINLILNTIAATAADLDAEGGVVTIKEYSFPWRSAQSAVKTLGVTGAGAALTITLTGSPAVSTEYAFYLTQEVDGDLVSERISWSSPENGTVTITDICDGWRSVLNAHIGAGRFDVAVSGTTSLVITSTAANPIITASSPAFAGLGFSAPAAFPASVGTEGVNEGADLLAEGIVDSFTSTDLPVSGKKYTQYAFALRLPKGHGGFNGQTSDQEVTLNVYLDDSLGANYTALAGDLDRLLDGVPTAPTGSWTLNDLLGLGLT